MREGFCTALQKLLTFFQQIIMAHIRHNVSNFKKELTNNIVSFEQSGPGFHILSHIKQLCRESLTLAPFIFQKQANFMFSASSVTNKLPPIQSNSAPTVKVKERMSWRSAKVNQSTGWGGGKKRGERH